jgi:bifunctional oligoribonuclease and PAP phosphatase NrnA
MSSTTTDEIKATAKAIENHDRFVVTTHENPDGDALGSILAMQLALEQLGKDSYMWLWGAVPLPHEYGFMELSSLRRGPVPDDIAERVLVALDCANGRRLGPDGAIVERAKLVVDIDHHHDNTRFGAHNLVVPDASSTGEILRDLFAELGVRITPAVAEALYIALVTDTGRFQYQNTTPKTLRLAAELVEAGANVHRVFQGVYESVAFAKLKLLARALESASVFEGGRLIVSVLHRRDFADAGAEEPFSEGIIDHLRAVEGTDVVALIREPPTLDGPTRRVSLRTTAEDIDVSVIARKSGGGGHRQAAGFSSEASVDEVVDFIRREYLAQAKTG